MQDKRVNAGYEIIDSIPVGNTEFVLGRSISDGARYVTWECSRGDYYFWGHYFNDRENAVKDLYDRVEHEVAIRRQLGVKSKAKTDKDREER